MLAAAATYTLIAIGAIALFAIGAAIIYHRHQKDVKTRHMIQQAMEQAVLNRMHHVAVMNLPPFYIDHEMDPVCIYEEELPPGSAPIQPILVHSNSHQDDLAHIPPEEDPLVATATSPSLRRALSADSANEILAEDANGRLESASVVMVAAHSILPVSSVQPSLDQVTLAGDPTDGADPSPATSVPLPHGLGIDLALLPPAANDSFPSMSSVHSPSTPASSLLASSPPQPYHPATPPVPARFLSAEMINMARLRAPPSYDVPNVVINRSPPLESLPQLHLRPSHHLRHLHSHPQPLQMVVDSTMGNTPIAPPEDYFGQQHARARSHTFSHPATQVHQQMDDDVQVETPRYSLEFPSHIPHEIHMERHHHARALFLSQSPSTTPALTPSLSVGDGSFSYSEYMPSPTASSLASFMVTIGADQSESEHQQQLPQRARAGSRTRPRASTLGESSKLLIQRMLWRARAFSTSTSSTSSSPASQSSSQFPRGHSRQNSLQEQHSMVQQPSREWEPIQMANVVSAIGREPAMATAVTIEVVPETEGAAAEEPREEGVSIEQQTTTPASVASPAAAAPSETLPLSMIDTHSHKVEEEQNESESMGQDLSRRSLDVMHTFAAESMPIAPMPSLLVVS